jgi:two-component system KDP operon response regulator KdpE
MEYTRCTVLVRYAGRVLTQRQWVQEVWGPHQTSAAHDVRVSLGPLRHQREANPARPRALVTEPGVGFVVGPTTKGSGAP